MAFCSSWDRFYQSLEQSLQQGPVAIATVIRIQGSVPREVGAKMLILRNGTTLGTIGGGAGEAKVIATALERLADGGKSCVDINLTGDGLQILPQPETHQEISGPPPAQATEGVCGGRMQVWVECWSGDWAVAIARQILQQLQQGQPVTLVTPFQSPARPYIDSDLSARPVLDQTTAFVDVLRPAPTLLIAGAGHVGVALAHAAAFAGFRILIQDDRPDFVELSRFPEKTQMLLGAIADVFPTGSCPHELYIALVTRGILWDLSALQWLFKAQLTPAPRYIGMIGSHRRVRHVFQVLRQQGVPEDFLASIHAPIGLDIGALTPEEIAISIVAQLILVRRGS